MNRYLCTFAQGHEYQDVQLRQNILMEEHFKCIINYNANILELLGFYDLPNASYIRDNSETGYGYCSWKPFIILSAMSLMNEGDALFYLDVADYVNNPLFYDWAEGIARQTPNNPFFVIGYHRHGDWTTKKCQVLMNCDTDEYYNKRQLEAGTLIFIKNEFSIGFLKEWLYWCLLPDVICKNRNDPDQKNEPKFVDHRADQAILTNMFYKYGLKGNDIHYNLHYITYNHFEKGMTGLENKHKYEKLDKMK